MFKKSFTFCGSKFIAVVKLVALRDVPRFCNKPQERRQMPPVTRRNLHVFLLLAIVWRYVPPRAACWLTYPLLRIVKLEGARAATVEQETTGQFFGIQQSGGSRSWLSLKLIERRKPVKRKWMDHYFRLYEFSIFREVIIFSPKYAKFT